MNTTYIQSPPALAGPALRPLGPWIALVVILNILFCTTGGYGGDIDYWLDWMKQLHANGYVGLNANYPPFFVHWLWLLDKLESWLQLIPANDPLLRFLLNTPTLVTHLLFLLLCDVSLRRADAPASSWNRVIALAALNPAILMNGPLWGQVDMIFCAMLVAALMMLIEARFLVFVIPLLVMALLTKFQTICIGPVLLPLFWHRRRSRRLWMGIIPAAVIAALLLLPYWLAGNTRFMFDQAYLKAASIYPYATYNGNNLWYLLGLNTRGDNIFIFNSLQEAVSWRAFFTAKPLGIVLCGLWGLCLAISSFAKDRSDLHWRNAFLAGLGFFLFLPGMHERYLMPGAVIAVAAAARHTRFFWHAFVISALAASNMLFVLHPTGGLLSYAGSALTVGFALFVLFQRDLTRLPWQHWLSRPTLGAWMFIALLIWTAALGIHLIRVLPDTKGWLDATSVQGRTDSQAWGNLRVNSSVEERALSVKRVRYAKGFGIHAASTIKLPIPPGAAVFTGAVGIDDEAHDGEMEFIIQGDGKELWRSGKRVGGDAAVAFSVSVKGMRELQLVADPLGSNYGDHGDWLSPRFRIDR